MAPDYRQSAGEEGENADDGEIEEEEEGGEGVDGDGEVLDEGEEDGAAHSGEDEEGGEAHVVLEEGGEAVVVEEDEEEGDEGDEEDKDKGVEKGAFELLGDGVGGVFDVYEVGGGADLRLGGGGRGGEGVDEEDDEEHADGDGGHDAHDLRPDRVKDAGFHGGGREVPGDFGWEISSSKWWVVWFCWFKPQGII